MRDTDENDPVSWTPSIRAFRPSRFSNGGYIPDGEEDAVRAANMELYAKRAADHEPLFTKAAAAPAAGATTEVRRM